MVNINKCFKNEFNSIRNLGSLIFITLRDETGIVQLISEDVEKYKDLKWEDSPIKLN